MDYCSACLLSFFVVYNEIHSREPDRPWTIAYWSIFTYLFEINECKSNSMEKIALFKVQMKTHTNHKCRTVRITLNEEYWLNLNELNFKFNWNIEWNWLKFVCDCTQIIRFGVDTRFNARPFDYWTGWYEQLENLFTIQTTTNLWEIQNQKWLQRTRTDSTVAYTVNIYFSSFSL